MKAREKVTIEGKELELSNLDKVMYPAAGFKKADVINYYKRASRYILPHIKDRPVTLKRFPDGVGDEFFYEKDAPSFTPKWVKTYPVWRTNGQSQINYILINDLPTLVWSANTANLEIHTFLARAPKIDSPTMIVFDLDPGEGADILSSCEVAFLVKDVLDGLNLKCFAKVSGSKGIHLHIPLNRSVTYGATQPFAKAIAQLLESEHQDLIVSEMPKAQRKGKVFIDWSQNSEHKSTVAVYSLRAKQERPFVAMPVSWTELKKALNKAEPSMLFFEPEAALKKMTRSGDLFAPLLTLKQKLPKLFLELGADGNTSHTVKPKALDAYREKRDFSKTPEPPAAIPRRESQGGRRLFVIQKHAASHLHYDLRLEMHGVLKSWAVPKGPPFEVNEKRLAMATEDHPMEYAKFEGIIPKGEYGGGTVMVWDIGNYEIMDGNYYKGKLHVLFTGKKLKGEWILVKDQRNGEDRKWLLIKAGSSLKPPPAEKQNSSALTSRSMEEISQLGGPVWHSNRNTPAREQAETPDPFPVDMESLPKARLGFIEPMRAKPVSELPEDSEQWLYEIKLDGYRCLALKQNKEVTLFSRNKNALNSRFPKITQDLERLEAGTTIDGEVVALDESGRPSFSVLQNHRADARRIRFYVFDLLTYKGKSLLRVPLQKRRLLLESAIGSLSSEVALSETFQDDPEQLMKAAKGLGLEGIVAKRVDSFYEPGERTGAWVKYRINQGQELVVGGYLPGPNHFDSLLVGYYEGNKLIFVGKIRNGFVPRVRRELFFRFKELETDVCPFANLPEPRGARRGEALTREVMKKCNWLKPRLVAQIEFTEWTENDHLRHPRFVGLRDDIDPRHVRRESG